MKRKIETTKNTPNPFGYNTSFGERAGVLVEEAQGLNKEELVETLDGETREAVESRKEGYRGDGIKASPGRPKSEDSELFVRMTFNVNKEQLRKLRYISWKEGGTTKDIVFSAFESFLADYEETRGKIEL